MKNAKFANSLLVIASCLVSLVMAEVAVRLYLGKLLSTESTRPSQISVVERPRAVHDSNLGYLPKHGRRVAEFTSTIGEHGIRVHGGSQNVGKSPYVLAVGDSFTFGDGVDDDESWPSHLEKRIGRSVVNGGVFGYGLDQTVLRAEALLQVYDPDVLIVSMIADDLRRNELSYRYAWKPYFDIVDGALELRNVPVPNVPPPARFKALGDVLSYSYLANAVLKRVIRDWWNYDGVQQRAHRQGTDVAVLLMGRVAELVHSRGIRVIVVGQADRTLEVDPLQPVLASALHEGFEVLDLASELKQLLEKDPSLEPDMFLGPHGGHMNSAGNDWVAKKIAAKLAGAGAQEPGEGS